MHADTPAAQQQQLCCAPEASAGKLRLVSAVHLSDVVALDVADGVDRHIARKWHGEVVAQAQQLTALQEYRRNTLHYMTLDDITCSTARTQNGTVRS
jgi:uncharacterized protein (DUF427 family)